MKPITNINEVIAALQKIIIQSKNNNDTSGYFAALYCQVTVKVKEGIRNGDFTNGPRMEKLDVIFASRYLDAFNAWKTNEPVSASWQKAFDISTHYWPIVLQHLLIGMNAHINLDLGIAAAEISENEDINDLQSDFNKINTILSSLVTEVQNDLANIWPRLKWILKKTKGVDDFLVDFSMQLARDGAWDFAKSLAATKPDIWPALIAARDLKVAQKAAIITNPGFIPNIIFGMIRLGERGTVKQKIEKLQ